LKKIVPKGHCGHLLTLTLTSDDINPHKYHYLVCGCIEFDCGRTDGRMRSNVAV